MSIAWHGGIEPFNDQVLKVLQARNKVRSIKSNLVFYSNTGEALEGRNVFRAFYIAAKNAKIAR